MNAEKKYAVIQDVEYYDGDCQHPKGWSVSVATQGSTPWATNYLTV